MREYHYSERACSDVTHQSFPLCVKKKCNVWISATHCSVALVTELNVNNERYSESRETEALCTGRCSWRIKSVAGLVTSALCFSRPSLNFTEFGNCLSNFSDAFLDCTLQDGSLKGAAFHCRA